MPGNVIATKLPAGEFILVATVEIQPFFLLEKKK
jgi:hypothetical protein